MPQGEEGRVYTNAIYGINIYARFTNLLLMFFLGCSG